METPALLLFGRAMLPQVGRAGEREVSDVQLTEGGYTQILQRCLALTCGIYPPSACHVFAARTFPARRASALGEDRD